MALQEAGRDEHQSPGQSMNDILTRLRADAGQLTIAALIQEREAAAAEIERLRSKVDWLTASRSPPSSRPSPPRPELRERPSATVAAQFLRLSDVTKMLGMSRSTIYKRVSERTFPQPIKISERSVRWRAEDLAEWCNELELRK